jgi:hypothetical protein
MSGYCRTPVRPDADLQLADPLDLEQRRQRPARGGLVVSDPARGDARAGRSARIHRRHIHERDGELARGVVQRVSKHTDDLAGVAGNAEGRQHHSSELMGAEVEARHDSEVAATAAQGPQQVGMRRLGDFENVAG